MNSVVIEGNLVNDVELKFLPSGSAVANLTVADTPRRFDRERNEWVDAGETLFLDVSVWGHGAEAIAEFTRGMRVIVVGELRQRSFETREGERRKVVELKASRVAQVPRLRDAGVSVSGVANQAATDPWGSTPTASGGDAPF